MAEVANADIREAARSKGVRLWEVAEGIGISDATFSRKLRRELSADERQRVMEVIKNLSEAGRGAS